MGLLILRIGVRGCEFVKFDTRELCTVTYSIALPFLFVLEQVRMEGF